MNQGRRMFYVVIIYSKPTTLLLRGFPRLSGSARCACIVKIDRFMSSVFESTATTFSGALKCHGIELSDIEPGPGCSANDRTDHWFQVIDARAVELSTSLRQQRTFALASTLLAIVGLAALAVGSGQSAPLSLCPVAVFVMILYLDRLRQHESLFTMASLRLTAETLRLLKATAARPLEHAWLKTTRRSSQHAVTQLAARAVDAFEATEVSRVHDVNQWGEWLSSQRDYYEGAKAREFRRAHTGRWLFIVAFSAVGVIGVVVTLLGWLDPSVSQAPWARYALALAAALGSAGLACINIVRDMRAFDHSLDYAHLCKVFHTGLTQPDASWPDIGLSVVREAASEHERWALRMAGSAKPTPIPCG